MCLLMLEGVDNLFPQPTRLPVTLTHVGYVTIQNFRKIALKNGLANPMLLRCLENNWFILNLCRISFLGKGSALATLDQQQGRRRWLKKSVASHVCSNSLKRETTSGSGCTCAAESGCCAQASCAAEAAPLCRPLGHKHCKQVFSETFSFSWLCSAPRSCVHGPNTSVLS